MKSVSKITDGFIIETNKNTYKANSVAIAVGYISLLTIKDLENYIESQPLAAIEKDRIWLRNVIYLIEENLYICFWKFTGWRSQFTTASGSGAHIATDILTKWNNGKHTEIHVKVSS